MNRSIFSIAICTFLAAGIFSSCKKSKTDSIVAINVKTVSNLMADTITNPGNSTTPPSGANKFTFYSLERNEVVPSTDSATNKWDIAVRGTTILTNGGNSGPGLGGGFVYVGTFANLTQIPTDSVFRIDNAPSSYALRNGNGLQWYSYNAVSNIITAVPGRILVVRTATGKYAKVEILNYYKGGVTPDASASDDDKIKKQRYYTFQYTYQADGSKKF